MSPTQALQNVAIVVRAFKGTFDEHKALDESLQVLLKLVETFKEEPKEKLEE